MENNRLLTMMAGMMDIENPTSDEQREIVAYMKAHSLKPVSPSLLPAPESKSAILFKETCSQCHALPDPTLHTAQEWTAVVERMRGNMQAMDRRVITDQEKADIVAYLNEHARK
jgi:mono/diheme cytochrome c family protein